MTAAQEIDRRGIAVDRSEFQDRALSLRIESHRRDY